MSAPARGARRQHLSGPRRAGAAGHAERVHRDRPRARGVPAHRRHLGASAERPRRTEQQADREASCTRVESLLVQVIKDPIGTKGARLSTQVSLAGRLLVYLPQDSHIGISQRIERRGRARERCASELQQLLPEGLAGGFIIRTMAETASEREMRSGHRVPDQAVARPDRALARSAAPHRCCTRT